MLNEMNAEVRNKRPMNDERTSEEKRETPSADRNRRDLKERFLDYSLRIIRLYTALPKNEVARVLGKQMLRSGTSVGAHHREAFRSRSPAEFVSKIEGALQELDETEYWLQLLIRSKTIAPASLVALLTETSELMAILTASAKTAKKRIRP